jgi:hypothetical protein
VWPFVLQHNKTQSNGLVDEVTASALHFGSEEEGYLKFFNYTLPNTYSTDIPNTMSKFKFYQLHLLEGPGNIGIA